VRRAGVILLCLAGVAASGLALGPALRYVPRGVTDFMDLYAGGKLAFSDGLYDSARVLRTEAATEGWSSPTRLFMRPPVFAVLLWPLAQLPYGTASAVWEILCAGAFAGFAVLWPSGNRWAVAVACCWSLPAFMSVAEGQDIGFLLLWLALAMRLLGKNRPVLAGVVFSLCAAKFHLFLLVPVWVVANRAWRFAWGLCAGGAVLLIASFAANGADWPVRYYRLLTNPANNPYAGVMPNLHGLTAGWAHREVFEVAGILFAGAVVWFAVRRGSAEAGLAAVLAGGVLVAPHAYMADCALLIPAVSLNGTGLSPMRAVGTFLLTPVPYLLLMLGAAFCVEAALVAFLLGNYASGPVISRAPRLCVK